MSGYTQESVRKLIAGSKRANEMKWKIEFVFRFIVGCTRAEVESVFLVSKGLPKNEVIFRFLMGEISGYLYVLIFRKNKRDMSINLTPQDNEAGYDRDQKIFYDLECGTSSLPLDFVKAIHENLPLILGEAVKRFPDISEKIKQLIEFADY